MTKVKLKAFAFGLLYRHNGSTACRPIETGYCTLWYENSPDEVERIEVCLTHNDREIMCFTEENIDDLIVDTTEAEKLIEKAFPKEKVVLTGAVDRVSEDIRKYSYDYKSCKILSDKVFGDLRVCVMELIPYSGADIEEMRIYGSIEHENYLLSSQYEHDARYEQWEWLKDE